MVTVVYIDSLALLNLMINYLLLTAAARIAGIPFGRLRLLLGAFIGALYAVAVWLPGFQFMDSLFWKTLSAVAMVLAAFSGRISMRRILRVGLIFLGVSFALGGIVLALALVTDSYLPGGAPYIPVDFKTLFLTAGLSYAALTWIFRHTGRHGPAETTPLTVTAQGRSISLTGLFDTGHTLIDPLTGRPVLIVDARQAGPLLPREVRSLILPQLLTDPPLLLQTLGEMRQAARFCLVPYGAVGVKAGFLLAYRPDSVTIGKKTFRQYLIGLSPNPLSENSDIGALVSPL